VTNETGESAPALAEDDGPDFVPGTTTDSLSGIAGTFLAVELCVVVVELLVFDLWLLPPHPASRIVTTTPRT
jgi:hypothetical protein